MGTVDLYYKIPETSVSAEVMYIRAKTAPKDSWKDYYNFKALAVQDDWVVDPWLKDLYTMHPFTLGIIKLEENTYYDWHIDTDRGVGLNLLLNNWDKSHCMFARDYNTINTISNKFIELKYEPQTYYLFNTQVAHTVYNFKDTRYLLSVDFEERKDKLNYKMLLKELLFHRWWEK